MSPRDRNSELRERFKKIFFAMASAEGRAYAEGFLIGWLSYLARHDHEVIQKLESLERKYLTNDHDPH